MKLEPPAGDWSRGLSTREMQGHREDLYGTEVSPTRISTITDAILDEVRTWQARPLASVYPILYFDALFVKSRQDGPVQTKAVYLALGVTLEGEIAVPLSVSRNFGSRVRWPVPVQRFMVSSLPRCSGRIV